MTSIMRRTVRGTAAGLGALAIVAGTAACGGLLEGDDGGDGPAAEQEDPAEGEGEDGADEEADPAETQQDEAEAEADADGTGETGDDSEGDSAEGDDAAAELTEDDLTAAGDRFYAFLEAMGGGTLARRAAWSSITRPVSRLQVPGWRSASSRTRRCSAMISILRS